MSDESEHDSQRRPKSVPAPPTVPRPANVPPVSSNSAAMAGFRRTTKMTADEISAVIAETERAKAAGEFDPEKTMVVDADDVIDADEAPTVDYDPRTRGLYMSAATPRSGAFGGTAELPSMARDDIPAPRGSESGKRRTSRRTVRIPDDPVRRQAPTLVDPAIERAAQQVVEDAKTPNDESSREPPLYSDITDKPRAEAADGSHPVHEYQDYPPGEMVDEITVVKPLRIISIGSDPPPQISSAEAVWPPGPYASSERSAIAKPSEDVPRTDVPSTRKTDLLPPPLEALESGWTPTPPEVAEIEQGRVSAPEIETSELLEDVEPDAAPIPHQPLTTPKRPPPPPPKKEASRNSDDIKTIPDAPQKPKPKPWFEDLFAEDYLQTMDVLTPGNVRLEVDFIEDSLGVEKQAVVLDLACGRGEHAIELAGRGYSVVGVDLSTAALSIAHAASSRAPQGSEDAQRPSFLRADMRELDFEENFDGAYCWSTSFGYFDEETNVNVLRRLHRALRQGGMLLVDVVNRDFVAPRSPGLVWFEGDRCVCMDDMYVDFLSSRLKVKRTAMFEDGHSRELEYSIRLYTLSELGKILHEVGFRVVEVTGHLAHPGIFFGTESPRLIILAERS